MIGCAPAEHLGEDPNQSRRSSSDLSSSQGSNSTSTPSPLALKLTTMSSYLLLPGAGVTAKVLLKAEESFSNLTLRLSILNSSQAEIATRTLAGQSLLAGETKEFEFAYLIDESLPPGSHSLVIKATNSLGVEVLSRTASTFLVQSPIRIAAGRATSYLDSLGQTWEADRGFLGSSYATQLADNIGGTPDPELYKTFRVANVGGSFAYQLEVPGPGNYKVRLRNCESWVNGAGQRLFHVNINGQRVLENYDIFADAGGKFIAKDRTFTVAAVQDGGKWAITIQFQSIIENPKIHGIEILGAP